MLEDFMSFLKQNYSETVTNLSKTGGMTNNCEDIPGNIFIEDDTQMIDMDKVACNFDRMHRQSTVDGLFVKDKKGENGEPETHFYLVEFKKMDLNNPVRISNSLYALKYARSCYYEKNTFVDTYDKCEGHLEDHTQVTLRVKPVSTLMLLHKAYANYKAFIESGDDGDFDIGKRYADDYIEDAETSKAFSKIKYHYMVIYNIKPDDIYKTNISNDQFMNINIFGFLNKLKPYPFVTADSYDDIDFKRKVLDAMKRNSIK